LKWTVIVLDFELPASSGRSSLACTSSNVQKYCSIPHTNIICSVWATYLPTYLLWHHIACQNHPLCHN